MRKLGLMTDDLLRVRLFGLAARPELNDREGVVVSHDAAKGRFGVRLDGEQKPLALKADNLLPLALPAGTAVQLAGLASQPELNGQECTVASKDGDRFVVRTAPVVPAKYAAGLKFSW